MADHAVDQQQRRRSGWRWRPRTLCGWLVGSIVTIVFVVFAVTVVVTTLLHEERLRGQAKESAAAIAQQTFESMYQVMRLGWNREQLNDFTAALEVAYADTPIGVQIYRGDLVTALYGELDDAPSPDAAVARAFRTGQVEQSDDKARSRHLLPVTARAECLSCHVNSEVGDVLGVVAVEQKIGAVLAEGRAVYGWLFLVAVPLVLLAAWAAAQPLKRRLLGALDSLRGQIEHVNGVRDLQALRPLQLDLGFSELNRLMEHVGTLVERLKEAAVREPLTGLYNQRTFRELLYYEVRRAERLGLPFAILMIDLDNFRPLNDRYGYAFGDRYLACFAERLVEALRSQDLVGRYSGDEFVVLLPETEPPVAVERAERIIDAAGAVVLASDDGSCVRAGCSIGLARFPEHGRNGQELLMVAESMVARAKEEGKSRVREPQADEALDTFRLAGETATMVLAALENHLAVPYFQPIVPTGGGGAVPTHELLMRIDYHGEIVPAGQFVEVAERMGVMPKLDHHLIEAAFRRMAQSAYTGRLFVNLSPRSLALGEFPRRVRDLCRDYGIDPGQIVFELTERESVRNLQLLERFVTELKREGFKFAIDDFGSGFSSFHFVRRLPIDFVKIEGEFCRNMAHNDMDRAFVLAIATLAQQLGLQTVAEYIEDAETLEAVRSAGIDLAQGFHLGRPGPELRC